MKMTKTILIFSLLLGINSYSQNIAKDERFPADYFMVHKNLPHYMQIFREYGDDKTLALSDEQKSKLQQMQEEVVVMVSKTAIEIRDLELALQKGVVLENKNSKQMQDLVEEIATLRLQMTNAHIDCIQEVKKVLTKKQDKFFIDKLGIKQ